MGATAAEGRPQPEGDASGAAVPYANRDADLRALLAGLTAVRDGDFGTRLPGEAEGLLGEIATVFNGMVDQLSMFTSEVTRVSREVGTDGRLGGQAHVEDVRGTWRDLTDSVNFMAGNLTSQVRSIAHVATAVAQGDLSQKIRVDARGEILELKETINTMVDRLSSFADEVTRVAREVGTEGILGGQARVPNVAGTWKDLTENVNSMADNLTRQVRNIAQVTTAVAQGDLSKKIDVDARGEILELKTTINTMVDQLSAFAGEVTRVAREVGTEGMLGGQAEVEGVEGTWRRLTENVNELAGNLTRQVRAIAEVASAVAEGDLTRSINVDASGEVAELKDNINTMVGSLRETIRANQEQDWLKSNLARVAGLMQGHRDLSVVAARVMDELTPLVSAQYGTFYLLRETGAGAELTLIGSYGHPADTDAPSPIPVGRTLVGQAAQSRRTITVEDLPAGYVTISSGLGRADPTSLIVLPILVEDQLLGVIELASVTPFRDIHRVFLAQLMEIVGAGVNTIVASARTNELLDESQRMAAELQAQQDELQRSNNELAEKAALLATQNRDIEAKNQQIEQARQELEDRARQLSLASTYKSEFLANMSHELRTPLNSLLILAQLLAQNPGRNLTPKQVEYAGIIHSAGSDLLQLINDILDLSKVEAGKMDLHPEPVPLRGLLDYVEATFQPLTAVKELAFSVETAPGVPAELVTDDARLRQVLRNLLSNAVKFTERGRVELRIEPADPAELPDAVAHDGPAVAFRVRDTGVGIPAHQLETIFGAFQQADGTTSRKYGGTGLGLSICREMAVLLGGALTADSTPGVGSTFTLYLPATPAALAGHVPTPDTPTPPADAPPATALPGEPTADEVLRGRTVLVVDDDVRNLYALSGILEQHGITVIGAADGRKAVDALADHPDVDLVVMDVMMPEMDGYTATEAIRRDPRHARLPIIAVTAKAMPGDREKSLAAGASDHVTKPVDTEELIACVRRWLQT
ncbi:HAMP domain-containing protein [Yinghuangia seranimata]|nr:HAMP domain-containing protein [Yinghuangia seranimata]MDI2125380.1 HAMP domain-containing protein [Yinghuangia seranimata]